MRPQFYLLYRTNAKLVNFRILGHYVGQCDRSYGLISNLLSPSSGSNNPMVFMEE